MLTNMTTKFKKGQAAFGAIALTALITSASTWLGGYILNSPGQAAAVAQGLKDEIQIQRNKLDLLCNDYGQTIYRMDQNIQNLARAFEVPVVVGKADANPCK